MSRPRKSPAFLVAANIRGSAKLADLPSDSARLGFFYVVLAEAKVAAVPGMYASRGHFREVAGRFARYLEAYLAAGILEAGKLCDRCAKRWGAIPRGALVVHDWHEHQYDLGKLERDRKYDVRRGGYGVDNPTETDTDTGEVSDAKPSAIPRLSRARAREEREREPRTSSLKAQQDRESEAARAPSPLEPEATEEEPEWLNALSSR